LADISTGCPDTSTISQLIHPGADMSTITKEAFERRVSHWFDLVFGAWDDYALRAAGAGVEMRQEGDDQLKRDMAVADAYEAANLPDALLAQFLDPVSPPRMYDNLSRADALLRVGAAQRNADLVLQFLRRR
jgi:hypothetical protein